MLSSASELPSPSCLYRPNDIGCFPSAYALRESEYNRGTGCGKTARPGLCGGRRVTGVPTARCWRNIMIHEGSCLCGKVKYEVHGDIKHVLNCHCPMCRKAHGAAFRTRGSVSPKDFKW